MAVVQKPNQKTTCPICLWDPVETEWFSHKKDVACPVCGKYRIGGEMNQWIWKAREENSFTPAGLEQLRRLSIAIRHSAEPPFLAQADWQQLADRAPHFSMSTKLIRLLEFCGGRTTPGTGFDVQASDDLPRLVTLIAASGPQEVLFLLEPLISRGLIQGIVDHQGDIKNVRVTVAGWERLEPIGGGVPGRVFVAMWFDESMNDAWEQGFRAGIADCGLDPRRIDKIEFAGKICDEILAEIRSAEIVVSDVTGFRSGVFFEAGFAMGPGKTVIFTCHQSALGELPKHFDTRQYPHIVWADPADLRNKLAARIRALRDVPKPI